MSDYELRWHGKLRRSDRALEEDETLAFLATRYYGVLAMSWPDGRPYAVPINYGLADRTIYMHCAHEGQKLAVLRANPRAVLSVFQAGEVVAGLTPCDASIAYRSALVFGYVRELVDEGDKLRGLEAIVRASGIPLPAADTPAWDSFVRRARSTTVLAMDIEHLSGKARA